jgi:glycosyltransferase involved in cell wall biosynthesis
MTADSVGGVWTYALELADALAERGVRTTLAVMGAALRPEQRAELRRSRVERVYAETFALEWMRDPWGDVEQAGEWLLRICDDVEPDLVHLNGYAHALLPWGAPVVVVGHSCVLSWFEAVRGSRAPHEWDRYRSTVTRGIAAADVLVAPTAAMLDALVRLYGPSCPCVVVPNGRRAPALQHFPKERLVVSSGRLWDEAKNVEAIAAVAPRLPWPVAVAGDGGGPSVRPNLTALGYLGRHALDRLLARAALFALPARYEPFGLGPLEAALAGCALVLGDIPSLREVWRDAALFVDPDDDSALEEALRRLIEEPRLRSELAKRARARATLYTPERMADDYLRVYDQAARGAAAKAA